MKKKKVFRKWVDYLLLSINVFLLAVLGSDSDNVSMFYVSHVIALIILMFNSHLLFKYSRFMES